MSTEQKDQSATVIKSLEEFILRATKKTATDIEIQVLPATVSQYIELLKANRSYGHFQ